MDLKKVLKVVVPLGLLLLLGPSQLVGSTMPPWTLIPGSSITNPSGPARNAGNAAPPLGSNNVFSQLPDRAAALWVPSGKDKVGPLHAIDALSPTDIWAVGETLDQPSKALVAHWDGTQWRSVANFNVTQQDGISLDFGRPLNPGTRLYDVTALAPDDVWAVGESRTWVDVPVDSTLPCCWISQILLVHWDGKVWSKMPSPQVEADIKTPAWWGGYPLPTEHDGAYGSLQAVTAVAKDNVWAVGYSPNRRTLILHWDGRSWDAVAGPDSLEDRAYPLNDIAATSANDIWAVGGDTIIHWDGNKWLEVYTPASRSGGQGFQSVAATSPDDVWAFGYYQLTMDSGDFSRVYAVHWDGKSWTRIPLLSDAPYVPDTVYGGWYTLYGAVAISRNDIWAVGGSRRGALVMNWNGRAWSVHNCPAKGLSGVGSLSDVVVTAPGEVWAVGGAYKGWGPTDPTSGFALRLGVGACPATPTPAPPLWPIVNDPPLGPVPPTLAPPGTPSSNVYAPSISAPRDNYLPPPVFEQDVAPTPVQTSMPAPVPSSVAPGVSVGVPSVPSRVAPAMPLP